MVQRKVGPAECIPDRGVEFDVEFPQPCSVRVGPWAHLGGIDQVVELRQAQVTPEHDLATFIIQSSSYGVKGSRQLWQGERLEDV